MVSQRLGKRRLVWVGTRGTDVEPLSDLNNLDTALSFIAPYEGRSSVESLALESLTGRRPDLDVWDIDDHLRDPDVDEFRNHLLRALGGSSALFTYRPTTFTSAAVFARQHACEPLAMFRGQQAAFEHKPWMEQSIARLDIPRINWRYVPDNERGELVGMLRNGPIMLRQSQTTGGVGMAKVDSASELDQQWMQQDEAFLSVAPFHDRGLPINVGGVVWDDGATLHPMSVQLIGIEGCTSRPFGFCGNDFAATAALDTTVIQDVEDSTLAIAEMLRRHGYRGAFGVDFLVIDGEPLFTEVNPRFQGSTHLAARLAAESGESCLLLEHLAAYLGLDCPPRRGLVEQANQYPPLAHIVVHHLGADRSVNPHPLLQAFGEHCTVVRTDVTTSPSLVTEQGAPVARFTLTGPVTTDGAGLLDEPSRAVSAWSMAMNASETLG